MITIECDNCERPFEVGDERAGDKVGCPHCGDVNRVPPRVQVPTPSPGAPARRDRAAEAGYPPDSGEERRVMLVRRCWFRSRPAAFTLAVAAILGGVGGVVWALAAGHPEWTRWVWPLLAVGGGGVLAWWWVDRFTAALEITNKRTISRRGLLRRSTSEVVHDNIRNVQVDQSFWQRVWRVGRLGISSSGQDGIEIEVNHLPDPDKIRRVIDLYRPM